VNLDPEVLDKLRRGMPLRIRASGALEIGGEPVTHARISHAIRAGLDVSDGGEPIMHLGTQWCYLTVDDTPFRVTGVQILSAGLRARLDDGRSVELDPDTLVEDPELGLRCTVASVRSGRPLLARFTNRAQMDLAPLLDASDGVMRLHLGERTWEIGRP
jgi:hypothetical protein